MIPDRIFYRTQLKNKIKQFYASNNKTNLTGSDTTKKDISK